jgi:hypothetical protein
MGHHDDRSRRRPHGLGDEVLHLDPSPSRDDGAEALGPDRQAVWRELLAEPVGRVEAARRAIGVPVLDEVGCELFRRLTIEGGQEGSRERSRTGDAECSYEERQSDEQPRSAIEASVDRPQDGTGTRPALLGPGRNGGHTGL